MNRSITLSVAALLMSSAISSLQAQTCQDGSCRLQSMPSIDRYAPTSQPWSPLSSDSRRPVYTSADDFLNGGSRGVPERFGTGPSMGNVECRDGVCRLSTVCRDCGCRGGSGCSCGRSCSGHNVGQNPGRGDFGRDDFSSRPGTGTFDPLSRPQFSAPRPLTLPGSVPSYEPVSYQTDIRWETDVRSAVDAARRSGRPMLVQVSASWCSHCQQMKRETYTASPVIREISRNFVAVAVDADVQKDFVQQMKITSLPTLMIVTPDLKIVERLEGFQSAAQLETLLARYSQGAVLETDRRLALR
ncbi:MAG: thioredoxin family protein [Planctomycetaceae bacterium]